MFCGFLREVGSRLGKPVLAHSEDNYGYLVLGYDVETQRVDLLGSRRSGDCTPGPRAEPGFTGGSFVRSDGSVLFERPAGRPEAEWELTARAMLGRALRVVPLPPLLASFSRAAW